MFCVKIFLLTSHPGIGPADGWYIGTVEYMLQNGVPVTVTECGKQQDVTANRLSLLGLIKILDRLKKPCDIEIFTDSRYMESAWGQGWLKSWKEAGWRNKKGQPVKNADLWQEVCGKVASHRVNITFSRRTEYSEWQKTQILTKIREESRKNHRQKPEKT